MTVDDASAAATDVVSFAALVAQLREMLADQGWIDLVDDLPLATDDEPVRVAFVGPFNAGKSSLIAGLTGDLSIRRSAKPESTEATRHRWRDDVDLVDLPGWFSGFAEHDARAEEDLRRHADLVVFVMTVELGDELVVDALEHVLGTLGFADRALVVINKAQSEDSDDDVIREEVNRRLGRFAGVPVIPTDAQGLLDTISGEFDLDKESIQVLVDGSGIEDLAESLDTLVSQHRTTARSQAQALQADRVAVEAAERLVPSSEEEAGVAYLDDAAALLDRAHTRLADLASSHLTQLEAAIEAVADQLLAPEGLTKLQHEAAMLEASRHIDSLADAASELLADLTADLAADLDVVVSTLGFAADSPDLPTASASSTPSGSKPLSARLLDAMDINFTGTSKVIAKVGEKVAAEGSKQGSVAYDWARKLQPKKKFKPHGRLNDAAKIQKSATLASKATYAVPVVQELWNWAREQSAHRQEKKAATEIRTRYVEVARKERERVAAEFAEWTSNSLRPYEDSLALGRVPLEQVASNREDTRRRLAQLREGLAALVRPQEGP